MLIKVHRLGAFAIALAAVLVGALLAGPTPAGASPKQAPPAVSRTKLSPRLHQLASPVIDALPPQAKSQVLAVAQTGPGSLITRPDGRLLVDLQLIDKRAATLDAIAATGAERVAVSDTDPLATFAILPADLPRLEGIAGLRYAEETLMPEVHSARTMTADPGPVTNASTCPSGSTVSEANTQLNAAAARTTFGVDGTGVTIGVLSDSFNKLGGMAADQAAGDLPGPGNTCGHTTPITILSEWNNAAATDEGRAMAQAVHDLAPGATISAASAFNGQADFGNQIRALRTAGAKVIADDVSYPDEPMYQDGVISKAINEVTASGVTYFSSAANSNVIVGGKNISSYEATGGYRPTACPAAVAAVGALDCHDFDPGAGVSDGDNFTLNNGGTLQPTLGWNEPQLGIVTNLNIYLVDTTTAGIVASSVADNINFSQKAYESFSFTNSTGAARTYRMVVARMAGAGTPRFRFNLYRPSAVTAVQFNTTSGGDVIGPTIYGHNANLVAGSIAAVRYNTGSIETYSSRGPATYCYGAVGPVAAAPLPSCLTKNIDVAATDGAQNSFFGSVLGDGLWHFFGTSQSAPHAAAVAVLQTQARPCRTPAEKLAAQRSGAQPIAGFGQDALGSGRLDASTAISGLAACAALPSAPAFPSASSGNASAVVSWFPVNGNGSAITGYIITPYIGGVAQTPQTFNTPTVAQTVTGLTNNVAYTFKVAAKSAAGTGPQSVATAPIKIGLPAKAAFLSVKSGNASVTVSWIGNGNGSPITGSTITPYIGGVAQTPQTFANGNSGQVVTGLTNGTTYTFKIALTNAVGTGPQSAATPAIKSGLPAPVAFPSASAGHGSATVAWFTPNGNGSPIIGTVVTPYIAGVAQTPVTFNDTVNAHVITGLTNGTAYTFKVAAINAIGTGPQSQATAAVTPTP